MRARTALALAALAVLAVPAAGQARPQDTTLTIKVTSVSVKLAQKDVPPKGASKGDTVFFRDALLNAAAQFGKPAGAKVGSDHGTMTFTSKTAALFKGSATLPGGTVTLDGKVSGTSDGKSLVIPVTGGTGRFKGAHGVVVVGPGDKRSLNTYSLVIPTAPVA
jgi:uncharacterized membrane protein